MVIASRVLMLCNGNVQIEILISIFAPEKATNRTWLCRYEIDWPDKKSDKLIGGFDSMQALFLTLQIIGAEIYSSNYHKSGNLYWEASEKGYGIPLTPTLRDLLQADDAKYL
jgi:hypothetical protein